MLHMRRAFTVLGAAGFLGCMLPPLTLQAQTPPPAQETRSVTADDATFSLEVVRVNSVLLPGGSTGELTVRPGDIITTEILLRNWSRNGDDLRAFQATIDSVGFTTGEQGTIRPVNYDETTAKGLENKPNCFVDTSRRDYVFQGKQNFGVSDSVSPGYRWMGAVLNPSDAKTNPQDGTKSYCGTMKLQVSNDARGTFTIGMIETERGSTIRNPKNLAVLGLTFERLLIHVEPDALHVVSSEPPADAIDARWLGTGLDSKNLGWDRVVFKFNHAPTGLSKSDFEVSDGTTAPPRIKNVRIAGDVATLTLDRPGRVRRWTIVKHKASGTGTRFGFLPGDVNGDGTVTTSDLISLIERSGSAPAPALFQCDIDGDGVCGPKDALREIDLMGEPNAHLAKLAPDAAR